MRGEICINCKFWKCTDNLEGECHRRDPRSAYFYQGQRVVTWWPEVSADDFCGEFKPLELPAKVTE